MTRGSMDGGSSAHARRAEEQNRVFCALSVFLQDGERFFCAFPKISFVL